MSYRHIYHRGYWKVGDRVRLSDYGLAANLGYKTRFNAKMRGTVVGMRVLSSGNVMSIRVLKDGYRTASWYYAGFWRHVDARKAARRSTALVMREL